MSLDDDIVAYEEVQEVIDEFERDHEELAALLEADESEKEFVVALIRLCDCTDEVAAYLRAKEFDLSDGETAIRDGYFESYAQKLCDDIGDTKSIPDYIVIDWSATAENLKQNYTRVDVGDDTYWVR